MTVRPFLAPLALALLAGCAPFTVRHDYDTHFAYAQLKTWDWYAAPRNAQDKAAGVQNPIMDRRVRANVEQQLATKGFRQEKTGEPDFLVTYYPVYHRGMAMTTTTMGFGWRWGWGSSYTEAVPYQEGSIVIEIADNKSHTLLWRGVAEGALTGLDDPEDAETQVAAAVKAVLARFPPPGR